jgi:hypothetical protein
MAALTAERGTPTRDDAAVIRLWGVKIAASVKVWKGSLVMLDGGYAKPGAAATGKIAAGRARNTVDNSSGSAGAKVVEIERGTFKWNNSAAGDAIADADVGADCYIVDDQTVAKTDGTGTRSKAGRIMEVEADGVWVETTGFL